MKIWAYWWLSPEAERLAYTDDYFRDLLTCRTDQEVRRLWGMYRGAMAGEAGALPSQNVIEELARDGRSLLLEALWEAFEV